MVAFVDPTSFCNLRCPACPTGSQAGLRPAATLDMDLYRAFLDEVGEYLFKLYLYNLGEPLLHKQAPEMIAYAKGRDIVVLVSSNLSFDLTDDYCERLVRSGLDMLIVPLDGCSQETYERYRRRGSFATVRANMQKLQAVKRSLGSQSPTILWQFLIFDHNEHEIDTVKREYRAWGADEYLMGGAYMPTPAHSEGLAPSRLAQFNIYDASHQHRQMSFQALLGGKACSWLYGAAVLNANGKLSPCCYTAAEKDDFGTYTPGEFRQVWNSSPYVRARSLAAGAWQAGESWESIAHRMDGRGMAVNVQPWELICQKCPVPFLQDVVDHELTFELAEVVRKIESSPDLTEEDRARLQELTEE